MVDTQALRRLAEEGGWRSDMENAPRGVPLVGLLPIETAVGRQPAFVGEVYVMERSALVDGWAGKWMTVTHWKPLDPPDTPSPTAAAIVALADEVDALREALKQGAEWFREYETSHRAKQADDKANRNRDRAEYLERALLAEKGDTP